MSILHGMTLYPPDEIDAIIKAAAEEFQGREYNLLSRNCNHFTDYLCMKLTGSKAPAWLNRAAGLGVKLPCLVPPEWLAPPGADEGELVEGEHDGSASTERSSMLRGMDRTSVEEGERRLPNLVNVGGDGEDDRGKGKAPVRDSSGRTLPPAERAPLPRSG